MAASVEGKRRPRAESNGISAAGSPGYLFGDFGYGTVRARDSPTTSILSHVGPAHLPEGWQKVDIESTGR
jgi:hypothetical protein